MEEEYTIVPGAEDFAFPTGRQNPVVRRIQRVRPIKTLLFLTFASLLCGMTTVLFLIVVFFSVKKAFVYSLIFCVGGVVWFCGYMATRYFEHVYSTGELSPIRFWRAFFVRASDREIANPLLDQN